MRDQYAERALEQVPRILSLMDRNRYSPTYGCFHRDFWMYKTSDFPDAVRQFGVLALALLYKRDFPGSRYQGNDRILEWAVAAMDYWASIQHDDGSFDEFYPFERGWVGPTAFTAYAVAESCLLLGGDIPEESARRVRDAIGKAARFIGKGEREQDHLGNHHAMACLAVVKAHELLGEDDFREGFERLWQGFLRYHHPDEGWSQEYDGVDPGYLSATVSFLGKIYRSSRGADMRDVLIRSAEFCGYFVYPNGSYGGSLGSRNTLHFYPHGFEILAGEFPLAGAVAQRMLEALGQGRLVPPAIMSDRYVFYRIPELLQAYLDYSPRPSPLPTLPYEEENLRRYFPSSGIFAASYGCHYVIANLAKGGVLKVFDRSRRRLLLDDSGWIGRLADGRLATSQWIDPNHQLTAGEEGWEVRGCFHEVPATRTFTLFKGLLFRLALLALGWSGPAAHWLKGRIRKMLMVGLRAVPVRFVRRFRFEVGGAVLEDEFQLTGSGVKLECLSCEGVFYVRYVPQSRFFQFEELETQSCSLDAEEIARLNRGVRIAIRRFVPFSEGKAVLSSG